MSETNFNRENKIDLYEAQRLAPGTPGFASIWRWCVKGLKGVRLEYLRRGRRIYTSAESLDRFYAALTALDAQPTAAPRPAAPKASTPRRTKTRDRDISRAREVLATSGI